MSGLGLGPRAAAIVAQNIVGLALGVPVVDVNDEFAGIKHAHGSVRSPHGAEGKDAALGKRKAAVPADVQLVDMLLLVAEEVDLVVVREVQSQDLAVVVAHIVDSASLVA